MAIGSAAVCASLVTVGGSTQGARNVVSGGKYGVQITRSHDCDVRGNRVGTDADGQAAIGNQFTGVQVSNTTDSVVQDNLVSRRNEPRIFVES